MLEEGKGVHVVEKWIVMDCGSVCHTARYTFGYRMVTSDGRNTGVLFGFFSTMHALARRLSCTKFAFCWDSRISRRKEIYPDYKANRVKTPEVLEGYKQFDLLRKKILPSLGFKNNFYQEGYEADDLIASICQNNSQRKYIASSDHDLYQLLDRRTCMVKPSGSGMPFSKSDFIEKYGLEPEDWVLVKAMAGCSTDNIKGIPKVAEKRAIYHLTGKYQHQCTGREAEKIINRNMKLVRLPMRGTKKISLEEDGELNFEAFVEMCKEYEFHKFLVNIDTWKGLFEGVPPSKNLRLWDGSKKRVSALPTLGIM